MVKCKTCHGKNEEKGEFESPWNESLCFKGGTLIMLDSLLKTKSFHSIHKVHMVIPLSKDHMFSTRCTRLRLLVAKTHCFQCRGAISHDGLLL